MSSPIPAEPAVPVGAIVADRDAAAEPAGVSAEASPPAAGTALCANCGLQLTGKYCSECGQRHLHEPVHHFWHFIGEAIEDLTHADSRLWQTLIALLFRPGLLTREFLDGRRVRYLPPIRLYLVVSLIFFIVAGLHSRISNRQVVVLSDSGGSFHYQVVPADKAARAELGQMPPSKANALALARGTRADQQRLCGQFTSFIEQHGGWFAGSGPRMGQSCLAAVAAGGLDRLSEAVTHNLERAMFLFLPLLALAMKPLYLKPPRHYVEHLLFFLHCHAFLFVILGVSDVVEMITSSAVVRGSIGAAVTIYVPVYFYLAMRQVYGQGGWLTLSKLAALGFWYGFLGLVMFLATLSYSFLTL